MDREDTVIRSFVTFLLLFVFMIEYTAPIYADESKTQIELSFHTEGTPCESGPWPKFEKQGSCQDSTNISIKLPDLLATISSPGDALGYGGDQTLTGPFIPQIPEPIPASQTYQYNVVRFSDGRVFYVYDDPKKEKLGPTSNGKAFSCAGCDVMDLKKLKLKYYTEFLADMISAVQNLFLKDLRPKLENSLRRELNPAEYREWSDKDPEIKNWLKYGAPLEEWERNNRHYMDHNGSLASQAKGFGLANSKILLAWAKESNALIKEMVQRINSLRKWDVDEVFLDTMKSIIGKTIATQYGVIHSQIEKDEKLLKAAQIVVAVAAVAGITAVAAVAGPGILVPVLLGGGLGTANVGVNKFIGDKLGWENQNESYIDYYLNHASEITTNMAFSAVFPKVFQAGLGSKSALIKIALVFAIVAPLGIDLSMTLSSCYLLMNSTNNPDNEKATQKQCVEGLVRTAFLLATILGSNKLNQKVKAQLEADLEKPTTTGTTCDRTSVTTTPTAARRPVVMASCEVGDNYRGQHPSHDPQGRFIHVVHYDIKSGSFVGVIGGVQVPISPLWVAGRMLKNGYKGEPILLISCRAGREGYVMSDGRTDIAGAVKLGRVFASRDLFNHPIEILASKMLAGFSESNQITNFVWFGKNPNVIRPTLEDIGFQRDAWIRFIVLPQGQ